MNVSRIWCLLGSHEIVKLPRTLDDEREIQKAVDSARKSGADIIGGIYSALLRSDSEVCVRCGRVLVDCRTSAIRVITSEADRVAEAKALLARARGEPVAEGVDDGESPAPPDGLVRGR